MAFANDWQWLFGIPVLSIFLGTLGLSIEAGMGEGHPVLTAVLIALAAFVVTWAIAFLIRLLDAPVEIYAEGLSKFEALQSARDTLAEGSQPRLEVTGFSRGDGETRWYLWVHNRSKTTSLEGCYALLERVIVAGTPDVLPNLSNVALGTQNQWRENRTKGRFKLDPDGTKGIAICEDFPDGNYSFRLMHAPESRPKIPIGKYRLKIRLSAPIGEPIAASILLNERTAQLE